MRQLIPKAIRMQIALRAGHRCEYCQMHEDDLFLAFEVDHIVALKHGGGNEIENLAYACPHCNNHKGPDLTTFLDDYEDIVPLFNPRRHQWADHFNAVKGEILPLTRMGEATIKLLRFNQPDLLILRQLLTQSGRYP